jgi:hypothetical protein
VVLECVARGSIGRAASGADRGLCSGPDAHPRGQYLGLARWRDHQPTETQVQREEKAAGIAPTPSEESSEAATLDKIYRELLH